MITSEFLDRLAAPERRQEVADELARHWGAEALFVLIPDPELGVLRSAPGFRQTLPGGRPWRRFLAMCAQPGQHRGDVTFPDPVTITQASGYVAGGGLALILVGGAPTLSYSEFLALPLAMLGALFRAECAEKAAAGIVAAASDATRRATALAAALDRARAETASKAAELQRALAQSAHLNEQLTLLNETLEMRVRERTRELEAQTQERLKAEASLLQAQKMEAVGQLTGGVAHDFNNLLSVIIGSLDLIESAAGDNERVRHAAVMAQRAADRGARLTEQLLAFSRRQLLRPQTIDINEAVGDYRELLQRAVGETVEIETILSAIPCHCLIDPLHFETAILNLAINARDAMPSGGVLTIRTAICDGDTEQVPDPTSGSWIRISVGDTGMGMRADVVERAFEPFFTTKPIGKGTGLGLSQVYGFVQQSGGRIAIRSAPGQGTEIQLDLPRVAAEPGRAAAGDAPPGTVRAGLETVLVVEDDPDVVEIALATLDSLGYRTLAARDGADALSILDRNRDIDLLFTDLVMPGGMTGIELADAARLRCPELKILLTSGYAAEADAKGLGLQNRFAFLVKPYRQRDLAAAIRAVLDGPALLRPVAETRPP